MKKQSRAEWRSGPPASVRSLSVSLAVGAVVVMLLWAACFPLIAVGLQSSPPMAFAAMRAVLSGLVLLAAARALRRPPMTGPAAWCGTAVVGFSTSSVGFFGMFYGGLSVSPGIATVVSNSQPLIAAVLAAVILRERLNRAQYVALMAGFGGIVLLGSPGIGLQDEASGVLFVLFGALGVAFGNVVLKRLGGQVDAFRAMGWQLLIGSVPLSALAAATEDWSSIQWDTRLTISVLSLAVLGTALPSVLWFELLRRAPLTQLNGFTFLTPVFGLAIGALWFDERVTGLQVGGIALSVAGIYLLSRSSQSLEPGLSAG